MQAKQSYRKVMDRYRDIVTNALELAEQQARQSGPDAVLAVQEQRQLFEKFGCTPALCNSSAWNLRSGAHKRLLKAYEIAIRDYTRNQQDEKAKTVQTEMLKFRPAFLDDTAVGGWTTFGGARPEVHNGLVTLSAGKAMSGIVTRRTDLMNPQLSFELAGSADVDAWIGIQLQVSRRQVQGQTCQIRAEGGQVKAGFWSSNFTKQDDRGNKALLKPHEFFEETIFLDHSKSSLFVRVNGQQTAGVGGLPLRTPGATGIFVRNGVLIVRSASQGAAPP